MKVAFALEIVIGSVACVALLTGGRPAVGGASGARTGGISQIGGRELDWFNFANDYPAGSRDPGGQLRSGNEVIDLVAHQGRLFAATSMLSWDFGAGGAYTGAQVLRKDRADGPWMVDLALGLRYLRVDCLMSATFTQDADGKPLPAPVTLLLAGLYDVVREESERWATVGVRDDATGRWALSQIVRPPADEAGYASVRSLAMHRDAVTGREYLVAGVSYGAVFRAVYDPSAVGGLRWSPASEIEADVGRPQSLAVADGVLHAAFGYHDSSGKKQIGGLARRIDGPNPRWEMVHQWYRDDGTQRWARLELLMRGLTAVDGPAGDGQALLGAIEGPPLPVIRRFDPASDYAWADEVDYKAYFATVFGAQPSPNQHQVAAAANDFFPYRDPETGEPVHLVTTFILHPDAPAPGANGAYILVRRAGGTYDWFEIADPGHLTAGVELHGVRAIETSPFAEDAGRVLYFAGYITDVDEVRNTAWIYRATLKSGTALPTPTPSSPRPTPAPTDTPAPTNDSVLYLPFARRLERPRMAQPLDRHPLPDPFPVPADPLGLSFAQELFPGRRDPLRRVLYAIETTAMVVHEGSRVASFGATRRGSWSPAPC